MKLDTFISLLTLASLQIVSAHPSTDASSLEKRESCKVCVAGPPGSIAKCYPGTCVDVRKGKQCPKGLLITGHCSGGNTNICCIKDQWIGLAGATQGFGSAPNQGLGSA